MFGVAPERRLGASRRLELPSVSLVVLVTGAFVIACALYAGPTAWPAVDHHKFESLACLLDISGVPLAWGVVSALRGLNGLSLAEPSTLQPWLLRTTADAYFVPVDSCRRLLEQPFGEAGMIAVMCAADSMYFLLSLADASSAILVTEVIKTAGQARACLASPPAPTSAAPSIDEQCSSSGGGGGGSSRFPSVHHAAQSCSHAPPGPPPSYCARLPWYALKLLVIGAMPPGGTLEYFLMDQIELAHDLVVPDESLSWGELVSSSP